MGTWKRTVGSAIRRPQHDEFKQQMHKIEHKLHNAPIPERQPASIYHLFTGGSGSHFATIDVEEYQVAFGDTATAEFLQGMMGE